MKARTDAAALRRLAFAWVEAFRGKVFLARPHWMGLVLCAALCGHAGAQGPAIKYDDGSMEHSASIDFSDDWMIKEFYVSSEDLQTAGSTARLWIYGKVYNYSGHGFQPWSNYWVMVNNSSSQRVWFDVGQVFGHVTSDYLWTYVQIPLEWIRVGNNQFFISESYKPSGWVSNNLRVGVDLDSDYDRSRWYGNGETCSHYGICWGELMIRLDLDASASYGLDIPSDFNGDGLSDLAVGAPGADIHGKSNAGRVHIHYGRVDGLEGGVEVTIDQEFTGVGTSASSDRFGDALASGDFNADGYADLAVGTPLDKVGSQACAGSVYVLYGSSGGLGSTTSLSSQRWSQANLGGASPEEADQFGHSLAVGDFDDDGFDDLAVGVPQEKIGSNYWARDHGMVHVIYGSAQGLSTAGHQLWHQDVSGVNGGVEKDDHFGQALAAGDFNKDGCDDLAIGVPREDLNGDDDAGMVNVLYGTHPHGLRVSSYWNPSTGKTTGRSDQTWHQDTSGIAGGTEKGDQFGYTLTIGDFDADGYEDLVVGVPKEDISGAFGDNHGMIHVIYGGSGGLSSSGSQIWHQNNFDHGQSPGSQMEDRFGFALASGDFDADGYSDLAVGAPGEDSLAWINTGIVHVLYGGVNGVSEECDQVLARGYLGGGSFSVEWDYFGLALTTGDFCGDGYADLVIGAPGDERVYVAYGRQVSRECSDMTAYWVTEPGLGAVSPDTWKGPSGSGYGRSLTGSRRKCSGHSIANPWPCD